MSKYVDPLTDFSFKRLFGVEPNKDLLIDFLNAVFQGRKSIVDLVYNKNESVGDRELVGSVIFDLQCTAADGSIFLIEVQRTDQHNLKQRMLYYGSKLIADQAPKGKRSSWNYAISEVYIVVLMDGFRLGDAAGTNYLHHVSLCCEETSSIFYEGLSFVYIELINFDKKEVDLQCDLDKWLYVLRHMSKMNKLPVYLNKTIFKKLFQIAAYSKMTKEECAMYDNSLKRKWDAYNIQESARLDGIAIGVEEGKAIGVEEGKRSLASALKAKNFSASLIAEVTGLSLDEIELI